MKPGSSFSVIFEADIFTIWLFSFGLHFSVYIFLFQNFIELNLSIFSLAISSCQFKA